MECLRDLVDESVTFRVSVSLIVILLFIAPYPFALMDVILIYWIIIIEFSIIVVCLSVYALYSLISARDDRRVISFVQSYTYVAWSILFPILVTIYASIGIENNVERGLIITSYVVAVAGFLSALVYHIFYIYLVVVKCREEAAEHNSQLENVIV